MVPKITTTNRNRKTPLKSRRMILRNALGEKQKPEITLSSISARRKEKKIADPKIELFIKNQAKYLQSHSKSRYTFAEFLSRFKHHLNIYSPRYIPDLDEQKQQYFDLVIEVFKRKEVNDIIERPSEDYTKKLFENDLNKFLDYNDIKLDYFDKLKSDTALWFNEIVETAGKYTFNEKVLE